MESHKLQEVWWNLSSFLWLRGGRRFWDIDRTLLSWTSPHYCLALLMWCRHVKLWSTSATRMTTTTRKFFLTPLTLLLYMFDHFCGSALRVCLFGCQVTNGKEVVHRCLADALRVWSHGCGFVEAALVLVPGFTRGQNVPTHWWTCMVND